MNTRNNNTPPRRLDMTKIDKLAFESMLQEHLDGVAQGMRDLTIVLGEIVGHTAVAKALSERISDIGAARNWVGAQLLDEAWRAASQRAAWGPSSRT